MKFKSVIEGGNIMNITIKEALVKMITNILKVKSIVTLTLTVVFSVLAIKGVISGEQFMTIFTVVISFYFGTQAQKIADGKDNDEEK